jgi:hypothetical protein
MPVSRPHIEKGNEERRKDMKDIKKKKICPLLRDECLKESCAWYVLYRGVNECALLVIAENLELETANKYEKVSDW